MSSERVADLIAELREMADMGMESSVLREAADEIERLRADLAVCEQNENARHEGSDQ